MSDAKHLTIEELRQDRDERKLHPSHELVFICAGELVSLYDQLLATLQSEADLKHDIDRHLAICTELAAENEILRQALARLVGLKDHKDQSGKTLWYESEQPKAWTAAREALAVINDARNDYSTPKKE